MPVNPCGAVCDWGRRAYRTRCRFFAGSPVETGIRWYAADPAAKPLAFPSVFLNSDWEDNDAERDYGYDPANLGEVRGADRVTAWAAMPRAGAGLHRCGEPRWYAEGVPVDPLRPPTLYNPDGLPVCCRPGGGLLWGGVPTVPRGGLYWASVDVPPAFAPCVFYTMNLPPFMDQFLVRLVPPGLWQWLSQPIGQFNLYASAIYGPDAAWLLTQSPGVNSWAPSGRWDGQGCRTFYLVSGASFFTEIEVCCSP